MPSFKLSSPKATLLLLASIAANTALATQVTIMPTTADGQAKTLTLPDQARLDTLLAEPGLPAWASQYSRISTPALDAQQQATQQHIITTLQRMADDKNLDVTIQTDARLLIQQLAGLKVAGRLPATLDRDQIRIRPTDNPALAGEYHLYLASRPQQNTVNLYGLNQGLSQVTLNVGNSVADLLVNQTFPSHAEQNFVYLCQPTGEVTAVSVAYWNKLHREAMPSAALYIGFDESDSSYDFHALNKSIAALIAARIAE